MKVEGITPIAGAASAGYDKGRKEHFGFAVESFVNSF